jgi:putative spermidine/putrescine transport system permease protein
MTATTDAGADGVMRAADGTPLKKRLRIAERRENLKAMALVAPLFLFILLSFVLPIVWMLRYAVQDDVLSTNMPQVMATLGAWDGKDIPGEETFAALAADLKAANKVKLAPLLGKRLNYELPGAQSKIIASARKVDKIQQGPWKDQIIAVDPLWGDNETWSVLKRHRGNYTSYFLLSMLDLRQSADGSIERVSADRAIYVDVILRTLGISLMVTLTTLALGYPVAFMLATLPQRQASILMMFVLLPFWTSLLVRTTAWFIILQDGGIGSTVLHYTGVTWLLQGLGLIDGDPKLIFSRFGTIIAMTHIQLPFTLLPIYSVMKTISPTYMRAARSLGAKPFYAFCRVYVPQTLPGVAAGCLLTFILCLGYFITPALVGGPTDQMVSGFIDRAFNNENNWGKASAFGTILLIATLALYYVYNKLVGIDKMKLG